MGSETPPLQYGLVLGMAGTKIEPPVTVKPEKEVAEEPQVLGEEKPAAVLEPVEVTTTESETEEEKPVTPPLQYGLVLGMAGTNIEPPVTVEPEEEVSEKPEVIVEEKPGTVVEPITVTTAEPQTEEERSETPPLQYGLVLGMAGTKIEPPVTVEPEEEVSEEPEVIVEEKPGTAVEPITVTTAEPQTEEEISETPP